MKKGLFGRRRGFSTWDERGQALVEFGLVSVAFFFLSFGVFDLARLFQSWVTVQHASREAARYAITGRDDCEGETTRDDCIIWTAMNATDGLARGGADAVSPNVIVTFEAWDYDIDETGVVGNTWIVDAVEDDAGLACDQIEVTVQYKHKFILPVLQAIAPNGIDVVGRQRMTNEPYAVCGDRDGTPNDPP